MNAVVTGDDFYKRLKSDTVLQKAFLFFGDEDYMKLNTKKLLVDKVCADDTFKDMNLFSLDPLDYSPETLADSFAAAPVFAEEKIVILNGMNIDGMREGEFNSLLETLELLDKYEGNIFLLNVPAGRLTFTGGERQTKRFKALCEFLLPVRFDKYTQARLVPWCRRHFEVGGYDVEPEFVKKFIAYTSDDMFILANEIKKLCGYAKANKLESIAFSDVEEVCVSYEEFGIYDLANAILARNVKQALRIVRKKKEMREDPMLLFGSFANSVYDMISVKSMLSAGMTADEIGPIINKKAYPTKLLIDAVRGADIATLRELLARVVEADRKIKSGVSGYAAVEKLICSM